MSEQIDNGVPTSFWVFSGAALAWNALGLVIYYQHVTMNPEGNPAFTEAQQQFFLATPTWATAAYGLAVTAGVLGSVALLLRRSWAFVLFVLSLAGVVAQNLHAFGIANAVETFGTSSVILPAMIFVVAVLLVFYSRSARTRGWLG